MFKKPNAIVYLRRNDLIVGGKHITAGKLKFTPALVNNLELQNPDIFIGTCQEFFSAHDMKGKKVLIVLDQGIVFSKTLQLDDSNKDVDAIAEDYIAAMPFLPGQRAYVQFEKDNQLQLYTTNADLYQAVLEALRFSGMRKLVAISPSGAYQIDFGVKSSEIIEQFMADKKVRRSFNFSTTTPL